MKFGETYLDLDEIDRGILDSLQRNCRTSLAQVGKKVGLSAPSVLERVKKLEEGGLITGYHARLDSKALGLDVTAFIGVSIHHPRLVDRFDAQIDQIRGVLECHHVTGGYTLLVKAKTRDTSTLEALISQIRSIDGVDRTETMVVLSTHSEHSEIALPEPQYPPKKSRRNGPRADTGIRS